MPRMGVPSSKSAGSHVGAPTSKTLLGPPEKMMPAGGTWRVFCGGGVRRPDFRVDRQLAQPPRDELGVLRPEIQNEDGLMAHRKGPSLSCRPSTWSATTLSLSKGRKAGRTNAI